MAEKTQLKSPTDFTDPEDWREYVRHTVPVEEVHYTLTFGRTTLFLRFYEVRKQPFPNRFRTELTRIGGLRDPDRTRALEQLNSEIFADMTQFLFTAAQSANPKKSENVVPTTPHEIAEDLLGFLGKKNPYFALWIHYTRDVQLVTGGPSWEEFVHEQLGSEAGDEIEFTLLMEQLGKLLYHFRDHDLALPPYYFQRIWFLHHLRGPERRLQARALVQGLVEVMAPCGSA
jgi:hypothetical protein